MDLASTTHQPAHVLAIRIVQIANQLMDVIGVIMACVPIKDHALDLQLNHVWDFAIMYHKHVMDVLTLKDVRGVV